MKRFILSTTLTLCMAVSASASTLSDQFSSIAVFGDSLSDNGNLFATSGLPPFPYFQGRFSNGLVWNEAIADELSGGATNPALGGSASGSVNLAFGGARADNDLNDNGPVPSVQTQIGIFLGSGGVFEADELVAVWAGANDIFQDLEFSTGTTVGENTAADMAVNIGALIGAGAKNLLVFNLPDIGATPGYFATPLQADATDATVAFNSDLMDAIEVAEVLNPDVNFFTVDAFTIFNDVIDDPLAFGFEEIREGCIDTLACVLGGSIVQDTYLFWDDVHPTAAGHRLIEAAARQALAPVPLPAGAPLLLVAMFGLGMIARRR